MRELVQTVTIYHRQRDVVATFDGTPPRVSVRRCPVWLNRTKVTCPQMIVIGRALLAAIIPIQVNQQ